MIVKIDKTFEKDTDKIRDKQLLRKIADCIEEIQSVNSFQHIKNIKKLQGSSVFYRIRINDYRLGLQLQNQTVILIRCLHRKDIYKYFPK
jgi:mRNA interferase RelE/StbE